MLFAHFLSDTDDRHRNALDILDFKKRQKLRNRFIEKKWGAVSNISSDQGNLQIRTENKGREDAFFLHFNGELLLRVLLNP